MKTDMTLSLFSKLSLVIPLSLLFSMPISAKEKPPLSVIAYQVDYQETQQNVTALAELKAKQSIMLTTNVSETVAKIYFKDGDKVKQGQLLVQLNQQEELAKLKEKRISATEAKKQYNRLKNLKGRANVSQSQIDEQYRIWQVLEAEINTLQTQLKDRQVVAPFSGQLGLRQFYVGDYIQQGRELISLDNIETMQLDFLISERYLANVKVGDEIKITTDVYDNKEFKAQIIAISPQLDAVSRMIKIRAEIDNSQNLFKTNMLVNAHIEIKSLNQLVIPNKSILMLGDHQYVYKLNQPSESDDSGIYSIEKAKIEIGLISENRTVVKSGLIKDDIIVSQGILLVNPRRKVTIKNLENNQSQEQLLLKVANSSKNNTKDN